VRETDIHGDPVHYGRALAMQGETCHRLARVEEAIESHMKLKEVYDVDKHSAPVVIAYTSDRCAQNFGYTANCYNRLGQIAITMGIASQDSSLSLFFPSSSVFESPVKHCELINYAREAKQSMQHH